MENPDNQPYLKAYHRMKYKETDTCHVNLELEREEHDKLLALARRYTRGNKSGLLRLMISTWKPDSHEIVIPSLFKSKKKDE